MANTLLTASLITREAMSVLHSSLHVTRNINHEWGKLFGKSYGPIGRGGATVSVRKPALGTVRTGWPMNTADVTETKVDITIDTPVGVDLAFSDADLALSINDFSAQFIQPNVQMLASYVDAKVAKFIYQNTANSVGTPGTSPNASSFFLDAKRKLRESLVPDGSTLYTVIGPQTEGSMVGGLAGQYNPQPMIGGMFVNGTMPNSKALGLDWYTSQVLPAHTCGTRTNTTPVGNVLASDGLSLTYTGMGSNLTYKIGDVFTIAGVYKVNYETKESTGALQQFVVTEDGAAATTTGTIKFTPALVATGPNANVSSATVSSKAILFKGDASGVYKQDLVFARDSFAFASADLELPKGVDMASTFSSDGFSLRFIRDYDTINARFISRLDLFYGIAALRPEWACRVFGGSNE